MRSLKEAIETLLSFKPDDYMITNLYLRLDAEDRENRKYLRSFKDLVKMQKEYLDKRGLKGEVWKSVEEDF